MKHADPRGLEARFTIGQVLALTWRAWLACRWAILLIGVPTAIAAVYARWLTTPLIEAHVPPAWQWIVSLWQSVLIQCIAYVGVTFAALSHIAGRSQGARDVLRLPWQKVLPVLATALVLQGVTWWPEPLFDWNESDPDRLVVDYAILIVNVLALDLLTFVWLPLLVAERRSMVAAIRESARFARHHPWRILAIDVGFWIVYFLFNEAISFIWPLFDPEWAYFAWSAMIAVWILLSMSAGCCLAVATYHLIRIEREGPAPEALARVFD